MKYLKNSEIARLHSISVRAVANWIKAASEGRLDIELITVNNRLYVANTARNVIFIERLVIERRKFRTKRAHRVLHPSPKFYEVFTPDQVKDIINYLETQREIPRQYNYFDKGAYEWRNNIQRFYADPAPSILTKTIESLRINQEHIITLLRKYKIVNVIDIGPGDGMPAKALLKFLHKNGKLSSYTGVDLSPDMISILEKNMRDWFGDVEFNAEIRDITHERFADIATRNMFRGNPASSINLFLFLGGTLDNFRNIIETLSVLKNSMRPNDLLIYTTKIRNDKKLAYFEFNIQPAPSKLARTHTLILDLLNIDESMYEVESNIDENSGLGVLNIRLKVALTLRFRMQKGEYDITFNKDERLLIVRMWYQTLARTVAQFEESEFELLNLFRDDEYIMSIHKPIWKHASKG